MSSSDSGSNWYIFNFKRYNNNDNIGNYNTYKNDDDDDDDEMMMIMTMPLSMPIRQFRHMSVQALFFPRSSSHMYLFTLFVRLLDWLFVTDLIFILLVFIRFLWDCVFFCVSCCFCCCCCCCCVVVAAPALFDFLYACLGWFSLIGILTDQTKVTYMIKN